RDRCALRDDQLDAGFHKLCSKLGHSFKLVVAKTVVDQEVLTLSITEIAEALAHCCKIRREARLPLSRQPPNLDSPRIVLGLGSRGQNYAEGGKSQKGASVHLSSLRSAIIELGRATTKCATAHTLQPVDWL